MVESPGGSLDECSDWTGTLERSGVSVSHLSRPALLCQYHHSPYSIAIGAGEELSLG